MADALDASGLAAAWSQVIGTAGEYQGMGEPVVHQAAPTLDTRHYAAGRDFAALHGRGPAVRVDLDGQSTFARLVVSVRDTQNTVAAIRAATGV